MTAAAVPPGHRPNTTRRCPHPTDHRGRARRRPACYGRPTRPSLAPPLRPRTGPGPRPGPAPPLPCRGRRALTGSCGPCRRAPTRWRTRAAPAPRPASTARRPAWRPRRPTRPRARPPARCACGGRCPTSPPRRRRRGRRCGPAPTRGAGGVSGRRVSRRGPPIQLEWPTRVLTLESTLGRGLSTGLGRPVQARPNRPRFRVRRAERERPASGDG
jgi:hypothetical protein